MFTPETKTNANHTEIIKSVCPMSGWKISRNKIGNKSKVVKKYLKYNLLFWSVSIRDKVTIKKGLTISIGWNLGKKNKSSHLLEPFTSIPKKGTSNKLKNVMKNKIIENLVNMFWFKNENIIKIMIASAI